MNEKKARKRPLRWALLAAVAAAVAAGCVFSRYGGFGTGPSANADEFARYAAPVSEVAVPAGTRVVALGEATHGNREFQELKLDVFKALVEKGGVRAFALEGDFGGCEAVDRYIHGAEGTAEEAAAAIGFAIYRTDEMADLAAWMRAYNESAAPGDDLRFYGFDMQRTESSYRYLLEEARRLGADTAGLEAIWDGDGYSGALDPDGVAEVYAGLGQEIAATTSSEDAALALHLIDCLEQNAELGSVMDSPEAYGMRDRFMARNVLWIIAQEEKRGNRCVFVSAHNGHIEQTGTYGPDQKVMGNLLADELGESFYAIGTDFFEAEVNLPAGEKRMTRTFYSYDPLAKAADECGYGTCWLDFSRVPDDAELARSIDEPIMMGSVGEAFSPLMYVLPQTYRIKREPASMYDSMVFVVHAHPTQIKDKQR